MTTKKVRVLIAKPGLDGHDRGAKVVARALRDAGMDVVYTGIRHTPEEIVDAAALHNTDVLGVSILSGAHLELVPQILRGLKQRGMHDVVVIVGGIIPEEEHRMLLDSGVEAIFSPGTPTKNIVDFIKSSLTKTSRT
jgi:methylmalonyl-CoA mutase C-terminal domain/subunit